MTRTPDEIKKGLDFCSRSTCGDKDIECPYECGNSTCITHLTSDALALIQQLQAENAALLFLCEQFGQCVVCKYTDKGLNESPCCDCLYGNGDATGSHWQWRGVQKEE